MCNVQAFYSDRGWTMCDVRVPGVISDVSDARQVVRDCTNRVRRKTAEQSEREEHAHHVRAALGWTR